METHGTVPVPDPTKLTTDAVEKLRKELIDLFDVKMDGFRELVDEKFAGVDEKFAGRDTALAAALNSAQELVKQQNDSNTVAIEKSATAFTKQIDSLDEKINDLKERLSEVAGRNWSTVGAYIVGAVGIAALAVTALRH